MSLQKINQIIKQTNDYILTLPDKQRTDAFRRAKQTIFKHSLYHFAKYALNMNDINERTHSDLIEALQSNERRVLAVMPRGTLKSSLCSVAYPIWLLLRNPNERILLDSEIYTNSKRFLREIKAHLKSDIMIDVFGDLEGQTWTESEAIFKTRTHPYKEASITCSGIGAEKTSTHYSVIIGDDLNSPSNSNTPENRTKVIDHYKMYTSLLEPNGQIIVVGTRYHMYDVIGYILENEVNPKE